MMVRRTGMLHRLTKYLVQTPCGMQCNTYDKRRQPETLHLVSADNGPQYPLLTLEEPIAAASQELQGSSR